MDSPSPTVATRLRAAQRLLVLFVAVLGILVGTTTVASASPTFKLSSPSGARTVSVLETRVGVADLPAPLFVGQLSPGNPAVIGEIGCNYDRTMVVSCVATNTVGELNLTETSPGIYESPGGLQYGPGSAQGHRLTHVMEHARPDLTKPLHTVFKTNATSMTGLTNQVTGLVDEAWALRGAATQGGAKFVVPMGKVVGTGGETSITIIVKAGTNQIVTAFPS